MVRTRIAPSPTGYPHIGTIYQIWLDYIFAKQNQGKFIIRVEDTDRERFVKDAEEKLYEALEWFKISEDESPRKGGPFAPYRQSERLDLYKKYAQQLVSEGKAYYCFCSSERLDEVRKEMQKAGKPPMYDKKCRNLDITESEDRIKKGEPYVIRLKVLENQKIIVHDLIRGEITFDSNSVDDQVILKSDSFPTYHLAVVVDDHLMEISHIIRGEEWLPSSPKHKLLYDMFGWEMPKLLHTPTLRNADKSKLSKRQGHTNVSWYMEQGFLPEAVINFLSQLGWTHPEGKEIFNPTEFEKVFRLENISPAGPVFDVEKLKWMNGKYIREVLTDEDLINRIITYHEKFGSKTVGPLLIRGEIPLFSKEGLGELLPLIKERMDILSQIYELTTFLNPEQDTDIELVKKQSKKSPEEIRQLLADLKTDLETLDKWETAEIEKAIRDLKSKYEDWGGRDYFMTIRVATTAFPVTPPLFESIEVLGKELILQRIESVLQHL
ncbi:MAG: glutamate--tRNA ligase [Bacteroidales bacterium]|nr:glutamate--tRNA ligase [Bacteroidales bacterium]